VLISQEIGLKAQSGLLGIMFLVRTFYGYDFIQQGWPKIMSQISPFGLRSYSPRASSSLSKFNRSSHQDLTMEARLKLNSHKLLLGLKET